MEKISILRKNHPMAGSYRRAVAVYPEAVQPKDALFGRVSFNPQAWRK